MLTIKAEIEKGKVRNDGTYNVKIRFTKNRIVKRISTDLFATDADLTADLRLKEDSMIKQDADRLVLRYRTLFNALHLDSEHYDVNEIVNRLLCKDEADKPIDFIAFSRKWISETTIKGKDNYTTALNSFVRFIGKEELEIKKITVDLLENYRDYLIKVREERVRNMAEAGKRIPSNRCLSLYLTSLRHLYSEAQKFYNKPDRGIIRIPHTPFEYFKIPKQEATRKRAIPSELINAVWNMPYQNIQKGAKGTCRFDLAKE